MYVRSCACTLNRLSTIEPDNSPSAALQWHYRILQALALGEDIPEVPDDKTIPRYRQIDKVRSLLSSLPTFHGLTSLQRVGSYITSWGDELQAQHSAWEQESRPAKRAAPPADDLAVRGKRPKTAEEGIDDAGMKKMFGKGDVAKVGTRSLSCVRALSTQEGCGGEIPGREISRRGG